MLWFWLVPLVLMFCLLIGTVHDTMTISLANIFQHIHPDSNKLHQVFELATLPVIWKMLEPATWRDMKWS